MGRRAKKQKIQTKKRPTLAKRFKCPFCANDQTVECKMDHRNGIGSLECRLCGASYQMPIHALHEPIDVFSEWLDDCEAAQQGRSTTTTTTNEGTHHLEEDDEEDDDDLGAASGLSRTPAEGQEARKGAAGGSSGDAGTATTGGGEAAQRPSYSALGLEDSDDEDDEEE